MDAAIFLEARQSKKNPSYPGTKKRHVVSSKVVRGLSPGGSEVAGGVSTLSDFWTILKRREHVDGYKRSAYTPGITLPFADLTGT